MLIIGPLAATQPINSSLCVGLRSMGWWRRHGVYREESGREVRLTKESSEGRKVKVQIADERARARTPEGPRAPEAPSAGRGGPLGGQSYLLFSESLPVAESQWP